MFAWYFSNTNNAIWLEALATLLAAIFAFVGLFVAIKSLKKDIKGQQDQINAIVSLAENMSNQYDALVKSMNIDSQILDEMRKNFVHTSRIAELNLEKNKISVKPNIVVRWDGRMGQTLRFVIENIGLKEANNVKLNPEVSAGIRLKDFPYHEISKLTTDNQNIKFNVDSSNSIYDARIKLIIDYQDIYANNYQSKIEIIINQFNSKVNKISDIEVKSN